MIECRLRKVADPAYDSCATLSKDGTYSQTMHWGVKGYGKKSWVVSVKIDLDYDKAKKQFNEDEKIIKECIKFLNTPQKSKYGKHRMRKLLYSFEPLPHTFKVLREEDKTMLSAQLVIKEQKNKHFWKTGPVV